MLLQLPNKTMIYKIKYWLTNIKNAYYYIFRGSNHFLHLLVFPFEFFSLACLRFLK